NGLWLVTEPQVLPADSDLMREWLNQLSFMEGSVEKDVVTDLAPFGLKPPLRQYILRGSVTNSTGAPTNRVVAVLSIGGRRENYIFARGEDDSVYTLSAGMVERLPSAAWQLRDRRVWSFTTNQISRVLVHHHGYARELLRASSGEWSLAPGSQGVINAFAVEETMYRLGELRAISWVGRGDEARSQYGFTDSPYKLLIELRLGDKPRTLNLEFSSRQAA